MKRVITAVILRAYQSVPEKWLMRVRVSLAKRGGHAVEGKSDLGGRRILCHYQEQPRQ